MLTQRGQLTKYIWSSVLLYFPILILSKIWHNLYNNVVIHCFKLIVKVQKKKNSWIHDMLKLNYMLKIILFYCTRNKSSQEHTYTTFISIVRWLQKCSENYCSISFTVSFQWLLDKYSKQTNNHSKKVKLMFNVIIICSYPFPNLPHKMISLNISFKCLIKKL